MYSIFKDFLFVDYRTLVWILFPFMQIRSCLTYYPRIRLPMRLKYLKLDQSYVLDLSTKVFVLFIKVRLKTLFCLFQPDAKAPHNIGFENSNVFAVSISSR